MEQFTEAEQAENAQTIEELIEELMAELAPTLRNTSISADGQG